jgi:hypothetical protein
MLITLRLFAFDIFHRSACNRGWCFNFSLLQMLSLKFAGPIPYEVIEFFLNLPNSYRSNMALQYTQPLTEMSNRNLPGRAKLTNSLPSVSLLSRKCENLDVSQLCEPPQHITGTGSLFYFLLSRISA